MSGNRPRCAHCARRVSPSGFSTVRRDGVESPFCHRVACRRAWYEAAGGRVPAPAYASAEALGAALAAADYLAWPWWARLVPQSARDQVTARLARLTAHAVERRIRDGLDGGSE